MSRRRAVLAGMCVLGVFAGTAAATGPTGGGNPPPSGTPPFDPPAPADCPTQETHPIPCRLWTVSCSLSSSATTCRTTGVSGSANAPVRKLALRLPRRFATIELTCRSEQAAQISCRIVSKTTKAAVGTRTVVLRLPDHFAAVRISCATSSRSGFVCRLRK